MRPAILWNDGRSFAECEELARRVPDFLARAGNLAMPGFTAPKAMWLAKHEPEAFARTKRVLLPKDYVRLKLTGEAVSEMSDAAGTLWLDIARRRWDETLIAASGLTLAHMPALVEGSEVSAYLSPQTAAAWGLAGRKIPVAGGGGDNAASAVGVGAIAAGEGFVSLGTSGVVFSVTDKYVSLPQRTLHAFCHALPGRWHGMSVMLSAAASLTWGANLVGRGDRIGACVDEVEAFARNAEALRTAPIFLPYLSGERTPHNDPEATGLFAGLTAAHGAEALLFAVMEGVAFSFADGVDVLREAGAAPVTPLLVGGGARSGLLGADDRRRDGAHHRPRRRAPRPARRSARRGWRCWRPRPARSGRSARGRKRSAASRPMRRGRLCTRRGWRATGRCTGRSGRRARERGEVANSLIGTPTKTPSSRACELGGVRQYLG